MRGKIVELMNERKISKSQMGRDIDYSAQMVKNVILGVNKGSHKFWRNFQNAYNIPDSEIESYKREDE